MIEETLFSPTTLCNLNCPHCDIRRYGKILSADLACAFLKDCKKHGIARVGFTGGEPFLAINFLCAVSKRAVELGMYFDRLMTNGVWFRDKKHLERSLQKIKRAGYDGEICVSIDAFHAQDMRKVVLFIKTARRIWNWDGIVSVAYVTGAGDGQTRKKLKFISKIFPGIRMHRIRLSPIGKAAGLGNPWGGKWFKEDYCRGPGNVFFVTPGGDVKPCCGYANEEKALTIGNIRRDSVKTILKNLKRNRLTAAIFNSGLSSIRKRLERAGYRFPGKTSNHCFFCHYIMKNVPKDLLISALTTPTR